MGGRQARHQLGTPGGAKSFLRGAQNLKLCPIVSNYIQHIFPGGGENFSRALPPLRPPAYGPGGRQFQLIFLEEQNN